MTINFYVKEAHKGDAVCIRTADLKLPGGSVLSVTGYPVSADTETDPNGLREVVMRNATVTAIDGVNIFSETGFQLPDDQDTIDRMAKLIKNSKVEFTFESHVPEYTSVKYDYFTIDLFGDESPF